MTSEPKCLQTSFSYDIKDVESQVHIKESYLSDSIVQMSKFNSSMHGSYHRQNELKEKLTALKGRAKLWCGEMGYNQIAFFFHQR